jgi:hypothetical protein
VFRTQNNFSNIARLRQARSNIRDNKRVFDTMKLPETVEIKLRDPAAIVLPRTAGAARPDDHSLPLRW